MENADESGSMFPIKFCSHRFSRLRNTDMPASSIERKMFHRSLNQKSPDEFKGLSTGISQNMTII